MYRPDRIGPYPVWDFDRAEVSWPGTWSANFDAHDHSIAAKPFAHVETATLADKNQSIWRMPGVRTLAAHHAIGFGVGINADAAPGSNLPHLFAGYADIQVGIDPTSNSRWGVRCFMGRAAATPLTVDRAGTGNQVDQAIYLGDEISLDDTVKRAKWQNCVIEQDLDADGLDARPIILGVQVLNYHGGTALSLQYLTVSLSFQKYNEDLQIFDSVR